MSQKYTSYNIKFKKADEIEELNLPKCPTGDAPFDSILKGGILLKSKIVLWGPAGVGKTRKALNWATNIGRTAAFSLEMPEDSFKKSAKDSGANLSNLLITEHDSVLDTPDGIKCIIYDSLHYTQKKKSTVLEELDRWTKRTEGIVFLIAHRNGKGAISGTKFFEHWPDYLFNLLPQGQQEIRVKVVKGRHSQKGEAIINLT